MQHLVLHFEVIPPPRVINPSSLLPTTCSRCKDARSHWSSTAVCRRLAPVGKSILTKKQADYVELRAMGADMQNAVQTVYGPGMNTTDAKDVERNPKVTQALINERAKNAYMLGMTREKVLQGFLDAIEQGKILADPMAQIAGWREIAKVCGFNAPEVKKIELTGSAKVVMDKLSSLPDDELLKLYNSDVVDIEAKEVP